MITTADGRPPATPKAAMLQRAAGAGLAVPDGVVLRRVDRAGRTTATADLPGPWVVRSSFDAEDTGETSSAGRFTSVLDVTRSGLGEAVDAVLDSADATVQTAEVLVMTQVSATRAGVAVLEDRYLDDLVEHVDGLADGLVGGAVEGTSLTLPRRDRHLRVTGPPWQHRLAALLADVRRTFGVSAGPGWDVEWADDGTTCWLVQVRPLVAPSVRDELLTLANHAEILPDLPSDLMTSVIVACGPGLLDWYTSLDPRLPTERDLMVERAGRPLLNLSLLRDILRTWGLPTALLADSMGGAADDQPLSPARILRSSPALARIAWRQLRAVEDARARGQQLQVLASGGPATATGAVDAAIAVYTGLVTGMFALANAHAVQVSILSRLGTLDEVQRRAPTPAGALVRDLTADLSLAALLERHGHRGVYESDLARPRYAEQPGLLEAARSAMGDARPRRAASTSPAGTLSMPLWLTARRSLDARERLRDDGMRAFAVVRRRLLDVAAAHLDDDRADGLPVADGPTSPAPTTEGLTSPDDPLWLLTVDEVRRLDDGWRPSPDLLDDRRARRETRAAITIPDPVGRTAPLTGPTASTGSPGSRSDDGGPDHDGALTGRSLSAGRAEGRAWVCTEPPHGPAPFDGPAILVARAVDGGWAEVFTRVDGVVLHLGGDLSHAALILREMGVPTLTGVVDATRRIATGDRLVLDTDLGVVELATTGVTAPAGETGSAEEVGPAEGTDAAEDAQPVGGPSSMT